MKFSAAVFFLVAPFAFFLSCSTIFGLEFHPRSTRDTPPASGYWYSDVPGSYNPWTDDLTKPLLTFKQNAGVDPTHPVGFRAIEMVEEGWDMSYYHRPNGAQPVEKYDFIDLSTYNSELTSRDGKNWVHGNYSYPPNTWVLMFDNVANAGDEGPTRWAGSFDSWYVPPLDISQYRGIAIEVTNLGDTYLVFNSGMNKWLGKGHSAVIGLEPGETDILYHPFRRSSDWVTNNYDPDIVDYFGHDHQLCGYPGGQLYESVYSDIHGAEGPWSITARVPAGAKIGSDVRWTLNRMWAGGKYAPPTMGDIRNSGHNEEAYLDDNWTDEYGQWKYDDWVGKIWDDQDAEKQYTDLVDYMTANPGPSEWDITGDDGAYTGYGGWKDGPQLAATGWFRVEKFNGKWWFVDPNGYLFLSQGSLHMSANTPGPAQIAGYDDATFPDQIYFPRLRSMGFNSVGGNSSWKWHRGKIPYTYQIKTGLAPITEDDILEKGGEEGFTQWMISFLKSARDYAKDPYCIGIIVDNELNISGGETLSKFEVERIYFGAIRTALDKLLLEIAEEGVDRSDLLFIDPSSNGGTWMANYTDVLAMHRMDGYYPATHKGEFNSEGTWGIDRPLGQFTFTMGNLDVGVAHYGLTMYLNQRNRAQGISNYMASAYSSGNNIACHMYSYMKTKTRPLTEFRMVVNKTDTTDYFLAEYLRNMGDRMYHIHIGDDPNDERPMAFDYHYAADPGSPQVLHLYGIDSEDIISNSTHLMSWQLVAGEGPQHGSLSRLNGSLSTNGFPAYTPDLAAEGVTDTFSFTVTDSEGNESEAATASVTIKGLVAHWTMEDNSGNQVSDATAHSHVGTFVDGAPKWVGGGPADGGGALEFSNAYSTRAVWSVTEGTYVDEVVDGAVVEFDEPIRLSGDWTAALWVQRRDSGPYATLFSGDNGVTIELEQQDDSGKVGVSNGRLKWVFDYEAPVDEWVHLAVVKRNRRVLLYVNGTPILPADPETGLPSDSVGYLRADLELSLNRMGSVLDAIVDDVRLYNHALSQAEIAAFSEDSSYIDYHGTVFTETEANDGHVETVLTMTLVNGGEFIADVTDFVTVSSVPNGLTPVLTRLSDTEVTLSFSGQAIAHGTDVTSLSVSFADNAFTSTTADQVNNSTNNHLEIDFFKAWITASSKEFYESGANDGSIEGAVIFTLSVGETFAIQAADHIVAKNPPEGLSVSFQRDSESQVSMTLNGKAAAHESVHKVSDLTVEFLDGAFAGGDATRVEHTIIDDLSINFDGSIYFLEAEHARLGNARVVDFPDASGGAYVDGGNYAVLAWDIDVPWACEANLLLYYASGVNKDIGSIVINGEEVYGPVTMPLTSRNNWTTWRPIGVFRISLQQGMNEIIFNIAEKYSPNFDFLTVTLLPTEANTTPDINVTGNAHPILIGDTSPQKDDYTDFGTINQRPLTRNFFIHNTGSQLLVLDHETPEEVREAVQLDGDDEFTLTPPPVTSVTPGGSTNFSLTFAPIRTGSYSTLVTIPSNDSDKTPFIFKVEGYGYIEPDTVISGKGIDITTGDDSPSILDNTDFGRIFTGQSVEHTFTIVNRGSGELSLGGEVSMEGSEDFTVISQPETEIPIGASTSFTIRFNASVMGTKEATVSINSNDPAKSPYTFKIGAVSLDDAEIDVFGNGTPIASGSIAPSTTNGTDFGPTRDTAVVREFIIRNSGTQSLTLSAPQITESAADDFTVTSPPAASINPGGESSFKVEFTPSTRGVKKASIKILNNDENEATYTFTIQGTYAEPEVEVRGKNVAIVSGSTEASLKDGTNFGAVGQKYVEQEFTIHNLGSHILNLNNSPVVQVTNDEGTHFTVTSFPQSTIAPGAQSSLVLRFSPPEKGVKTALIKIGSDDFDETPYTFIVQGEEGKFPWPTFLPAITNRGK